MRALAKSLVGSLLVMGLPFAVAQVQPTKSIEAKPGNILNLGSGGVLVSRSAEYNQTWMAQNLIDGDVAIGWSSPQNKPFPHSFVIELPQSHQIDSITFDNTRNQEGGYPGISARQIEVWGSASGRDSGFTRIATLESPKGTRKEFPLPAGTTARWLKLVITSNWGNKEYTELMEVEAHGKPVGERAMLPEVSGVFDTNYDKLKIVQHGNQVLGCYQPSSGFLFGATDGRAMEFEWWQANNGHGTAIMALSSDGSILNGIWFVNGQRQGQWFGQRSSDQKINCDPNSGNNLAQSIETRGQAVLYGIHFDSDSAQLKPESEAALQQVKTLLQSQPKLHLRVEGHTDSTNTDAYNLDLSKRRAQSVMQWLVQHGIPAAQLTAEGIGKAQPVADNATPEGRALNRRVEILKVP